jgi:hypothetical protein
MTARILRHYALSTIPLHDYGLRLAALEQGKTPEQYVEWMSKEGQWAGIFELLSCIKYLNIPVTVITVDPVRLSGNVRTYTVNPSGEICDNEGWGYPDTAVIAYNGESHFYATLPLVPALRTIIHTPTPITSSSSSMISTVSTTTTTAAAAATTTTTTSSSTADYPLDDLYATITTTEFTTVSSSSSSSSSGRPNLKIHASIPISLRKDFPNIDVLIKVRTIRVTMFIINIVFPHYTAVFFIGYSK